MMVFTYTILRETFTAYLLSFTGLASTGVVLVDGRALLGGWLLLNTTKGGWPDSLPPCDGALTATALFAALGGVIFRLS